MLVGVAVGKGLASLVLQLSLTALFYELFLWVNGRCISCACGAGARCEMAGVTGKLSWSIRRDERMRRRKADVELVFHAHGDARHSAMVEKSAQGWFSVSELALWLVITLAAVVKHL